MKQLSSKMTIKATLLLMPFVAMLFAVETIQAGEGKAEKIQRILKMRQGKKLLKPAAFKDRKLGRMDNGRMVVYHDNNGFIGDRDYTRSVEWPAGTLNYMIWQVGIVFGAVNADGDTICSESYNDISDNQFNPEPGFDNPDYVSPIFETAIVPRSDIVESYAPQWNGLWPALGGGFIDPTELRNLARQESYWIMRDDNAPAVSSQPPLHVEVECRLIQINSRLTRDFVFAFYRVKNISGGDLRNCRFGVLVDPDMPALVGAEFEDDSDGFIKDLNLAYAFDSDNFYASKPGFNIGQFGTKFLRSPEVNGQELGLTAWTTFEYGDMPAPGEYYLTPDGPDDAGPQFQSRDHAQYHYMQPGLFMKPRLNTDVGYLMSSGDFDLKNGESVEMGVAFIAAPNFETLLRNAEAAQRIYDNNFIGPTAPNPPAVTAVPGNHSATLYWDDVPSENSVDPFTGKADFEGYRIYRSADRGQTWGTPTQLEDIYPFGFVPIADFDKFNSEIKDISGVVVAHNASLPDASNAVILSAGLADGSQGGDAEVDLSGAFSGENYTIEFQTETSFRVNNTSLPARVAYLPELVDADGEIVNGGKGFCVLDESFAVQPPIDEYTGRYTSGHYIYLDGIFVQIMDNFADSTKDGTVNAGEIFRIEQKKIDPGANTGLKHVWKDPDKLINGYEYWYTVTAYDRPDPEINLPTNENQANTIAEAFSDDQTVSVVPQAPAAGLVQAKVDTVFDHVAGSADIAGFELQIIDPRKMTGDRYEISFTVTDTDKTYTVTNLHSGVNVLDGQRFYDPAFDNAKMFDGLRVIVTDVEFNINYDNSVQTVQVAGEELAVDPDVSEPWDPNDHDFLFKFVQNPEDSASFQYLYADWDTGEPVAAPFIVIDLTTGDTLTVEILDTREGEGDADGAYDVAERIAIGDTPYQGTGGWEANTYFYRFGFIGDYVAGTEYRLVTNKPITAADKYQFSTATEVIDAEQAKRDLAKIRVVPNPFIVTSGFDTVADRHEIHFTRLPAECTIKVFTLTGELVKTIKHNRAADNREFAKWDLKTEFGSEVAYGVYLYHIDSPAGTNMGKLAIMR